MRCPDPLKLQNFAIGTLPAAELQDIATHLADCSRCEAALARCDPLDHLVAALRGLPLTQSRATTRVGAALAVPRALADQLVAARGSAIVADPGRALSKKLRAGSCRLGKFELEAELGVGSFGYVFRARDTELDRVVALKVQRGAGLSSDDEVNRFLREARSAARLKHPGIVALYESGQTPEGVCFLVIEYVAGCTLEALFARERLEPPKLVECLIQLTDALAYAHSQGVIHRDIKPANIMIDALGRPHIMDFGLAKRESGEKSLTADGQVLGTPAYMSPEQARGDSQSTDARSDIYSLGVIMYEALSGERPFQGNRRMLLLKVLAEEPRPPRQLDERIPRALETICLKAMSKERQRRYASARQFGDDLRRFQAGQPIEARPIGALESLWSWCRVNPLAVSLLIAISIGALGGLWYLSSLAKYFVEQTALSSVQKQAETIEEINALYSENVERLDPSAVALDGDYSSAHRVMLPASFTIEAGKRISAGESGMHVRLYSDFPFPWRQDGGPRDDFERDALARLRRRPAEAVHEFTELNGRPVVRFAAARFMQESCIGCHNTHPDSPKRDWAAGDVRGVLEIVRPLDKDIARVRSGLAGAFVLTGVITLLLLVLSVLLMRARRGRLFLPQPAGDDGGTV